MTRKLDWKWIGIGVLIMIALNIVAGLVLTLVLGHSRSSGPQSLGGRRRPLHGMR